MKGFTDSFGILLKTGDSLPRRYTRAETPHMWPSRTRVMDTSHPKPVPQNFQEFLASGQRRPGSGTEAAANQDLGG